MNLDVICGATLGFWLGAAVAGQAADAVAVNPSVPPPDRILDGLRAERPRLLLAGPGDVARLREKVRTDETSATWLAALTAAAEIEFKAAPVKYEIPDGKRLLSVSRELKGRIELFGLMFLIGEDARWRDRAWRELEEAAGFKDWNPSHFLDTAEMTAGFGLAYDWFHAQWTADQRRAIRTAIVEFGLKPGLSAYKKGRGWVDGWNNWNQVCNGGLSLGALAIADEEPDLAGRILHEAVRRVPAAMSHYEPDGGGVEGVTYWQYGSRYNVPMIAALQSALGTDFGLLRLSGFAKSGFYPIYMSGADRQTFNFADCGTTEASAAELLWMGRAYGRPEYTRFRMAALADSARPSVMDVLWREPEDDRAAAKPLPSGRHFRSAECASLRGAWNDPDALVLGIQAGNNLNLGGHRHLDLGTFILEARGARWIVDPGSERETYLSHQHSHPRHEFYRLRAEGHNTLVFNPGTGPDQVLDAVAPISVFETTAAGGRAVVQLSAAYAPHARRVERAFVLEANRRVTVTDRILVDQPVDLWWFVHTPAQISLADDRRSATLRIGDKRMMVRLAEPSDAVFEIREAEPLPTSPNPPKQASNSKIRKLAIHLEGVQSTRIAVAFEPEERAP